MCGQVVCDSEYSGELGLDDMDVVGCCQQNIDPNMVVSVGQCCIMVRMGGLGGVGGGGC